MTPESAVGSKYGEPIEDFVHVARIEDTDYCNGDACVYSAHWERCEVAATLKDETALDGEAGR